MISKPPSGTTIPQLNPTESGTPVSTPTKPKLPEPATGETQPVERAPAEVARPAAAAVPNQFRWLITATVRVVMLAVGIVGIYYGRPYIEKLTQQWKPAAKTDKPSGARTVSVVTAPVRRDTMKVYLNGLGTITAFQTVTVRSRVEGELINVAFQEGQMVKEGALLAEIDSRPFLARLQQAEGQLVKDEAMVRGARLTLERNQKLLATQTVTAQLIDEQVALLGQAEGAVLADRAIIEDAKLQVTYSRILAPISGRIGLRLIDQGNMVRVNDPTGIAVITQLQPITMTFTVPQDDIARVQARHHATQGLKVEAYNRDFDTKLATGKLLAIDNQVDITTGTVRLKAVFDNDDFSLFPNQFVNARLLVDEIPGAIVVPTAAVQHGPDYDFVYVVEDDEKVKLHTIRTGVSEGEATVIQSGLNEGQVVVTGGMDKLQNGTKVTALDKKPAGEGTKQARGKNRSQDGAANEAAAPSAPARRERTIETAVAPNSVTNAPASAANLTSGQGTE